MSRQIHLRLTAVPHGLQVSAETAEGTFLREVTEAELERFAAQTLELRSTAENGMRPLVDPVDLLAYGRALGGQCLPPELLAPGSGLNEADGSLVIVTDDGAVPDLGWELLCDSAGRYVCGERRWSVCRRATPSGTGKPWVARSGPLRVLLVASSPEAPGVHSLDYEKEEEAILKATRGLGLELHLEVALMGSLDELRELVNSYRPHVLHLSGHGVNREGVGMFCFEDERGRVDERSGSMIALEALAESSVGCVFVSACQSAQAGVAGLCRTLVEQAAVPVAIGWGASIADDRATAFAQAFYRELSLGRSVPQAVVTAQARAMSRSAIRSPTATSATVSRACGKVLSGVGAFCSAPNPRCAPGNSPWSC